LLKNLKQKMKWIIENVKRTSSEGLVVKINYNVVAKDKELIANKRGSVELSGDPNAEDFIPFEDLTRQNLVDWVKANVNVEAIENEVDSILQEKVAARSARTLISGLPKSFKF
jgi:hypothetical protein